MKSVVARTVVRAARAAMVAARVARVAMAVARAARVAMVAAIVVPAIELELIPNLQ